MSNFLPTKRISRIKSSIQSEKCLRICWLIQALPMAIFALPASWLGMVFIRLPFGKALVLTNLDLIIIFAMWIMGCSFCIQAAKFPTPWFKDSVMLANTIYESVVCSAAILRFSPKLAQRDDGVWYIGVLVITTISVYILTLRSYLVWWNDVTRTDEEEEVGMIVL